MCWRFVIGLCLLFSPFIAGCDVEIPEGVFACTQDGQCPDGWICSPDGFCKESPAGGAEGSCVPDTSAACSCPGGGEGVKVCNADGRWGKCESCAGDTAGSGAGGQDAVNPDNPRIGQCLAHVPDSISLGCKVCLCERCPDESLACDTACWALIACTLSQCPEADPTCIANRCASVLQGRLDPAVEVVTCGFDCMLVCGQS